MKERKTKILKLRVTETELSRLRKRAESYRSSMSAMLREALAQFDDRHSSERFAIMDSLYTLHRSQDAQLGRIGNNLNQAVHRLNALVLEGNINTEMIQSALMPQVADTYSLLCDIKECLDKATMAAISSAL